MSRQYTERMANMLKINLENDSESLGTLNSECLKFSWMLSKPAQSSYINITSGIKYDEWYESYSQF